MYSFYPIRNLTFPVSSLVGTSAIDTFSDHQDKALGRANQEQESGAVHETTFKEWRENTLSIPIKEYSPSNIFYFDETTLFSKLMPDSSIVFRNEETHGGKKNVKI